MKKTIFIIFLILTLGLGGLWLIFRNDAPPAPDRVALNGAVMTALRSDDRNETLALLTEYLVRDTERLAADQKENNKELFIFLGVFIGLSAVICGWFFGYCERTILRPFRRLEQFAARVAQGDLSIPLDMDRKNRFGAFSESFDLMREQLAAARENERLADISKKELVASLSHDIKTPVSSIKAIAEVYQAKHGDIAELRTITGKADQIDLLISNMFTATLEELQQLKVLAADVESGELAEIIRAADYANMIKPFVLPDCVVSADRLRFKQIVDNILGNSYKYAGTPVEASACFEEGFLALTLRDSGPGVSPEELPLLCRKFYRAGNAEGIGGSGLGLYLSRYFMEEMGGSLTLGSRGGLWVTLRLKI